jgi:epoxyqueuosine reductase
MTKNQIKSFLERKCAEYGFLSAGILSPRGETMKKAIKELEKIYSPLNPSIISPYLLKTLEKRKNPLAFRQSAMSLLIAAVPVLSLPPLNLSLPKPRRNSPIGKMAAYAGMPDYHTFCKERILLLVEDIGKEIGQKFDFEICVDTMPLAEKILAKFAGLGYIGRSSCLVRNGASSFFIAAALLDIELPESFPEKQPSACGNCLKCERLCPGQAISASGLNPSKCVSYITMEKKGKLSDEEIGIIGGWIFGCDICLSACPNSKIPPPLEIDLEWFLSLTKKEFEKIFHQSPCLYSGWEKMRRNAEANLSFAVQSAEFKLSS